jgi:type II secretory pathway component PulF
LALCGQLFPPTLIEMVSVAEESGRLDEELVRLAEESERELDAQLRIAVALAEPALLFLMAALIGTIFVGMVLPIFTIQDYIS